MPSHEPRDVFLRTPPVPRCRPCAGWEPDCPPPIEREVDGISRCLDLAQVLYQLRLCDDPHKLLSIESISTLLDTFFSSQVHLKYLWKKQVYLKIRSAGYG
jgi:hypothetical protein